MQEAIVLMDDYGSLHKLYINVSQQANRQSLITAAQVAMSQRQAQLETYAAANGHDLSTTKLPNLTAKQAKLKGVGK
jgi:hypothetical protein